MINVTLDRMSEDDDSNPFRPPRSQTEPSSVAVLPVALRRAVAFQLLVIAAGLALETYDHETIVGTGPVLFTAGLVVVLLSRKQGAMQGIMLGSSAMGLCLLVVILINVCGWGPAQGDAPITAMAWLYALITATPAIRVIRAGFRAPTSQRRPIRNS